MDLKGLYTEHLRTLARDTEQALALCRDAGEPYDGIVFHAGKQMMYHADDHPVVFHSVPHFARFAPVPGPDHLLLFRPGAATRLVRVVPRDFWYETAAEPEHPYPEVLAVTQVATPEEAQKQLGDVSRCAYVGNDAATAAALGMPPAAVEPRPLVAALDWNRACKTPYEVTCIRAAARIAARGYAVVRQGAAQQMSERQLHAAYLEATGMLENDTPYTNIIAWDDHAATLHYQTKRTTPPEPGASLLIDAGAVHHGYASDITRTYGRDNLHPVFRRALDRMEVMQRQLVAAVGPGVSFVDLHAHAHRGVAAILCDLGILKVDAAAAHERGLTRPFLPHGLGHHLGLQVHDVGGRQASPAGEHSAPPPEYPSLRTTRELAPGHVVTIEPGLYFIPMLLEPFRAGTDAGAFDWKLVDALVPSGGIRIEDDILVTPQGRDDLTRPFVPGHLDA